MTITNEQRLSIANNTYPEEILDIDVDDMKDELLNALSTNKSIKLLNLKCIGKSEDVQFLAALPSFLTYLPSVYIDIEDLNIRGYYSYEENKQIIKILSGIPNIRIKNLQGINWDLNSMSIWTKSLMNNSFAVDKIVINAITEDEMVKLRQALSTNTTLSGLSLNISLENFQGFSALSELLIENSAIERLSIEGYGLSRNLTIKQFLMIAEGLYKNKTLKEFHLDALAVTDEMFLILLEALNKNDTLETLAVTNSSINYVSLCRLAEFLKNNKSLTTLKVSGNSELDPGLILGCEDWLEKIADALKFNNSLKNLGLGINRLVVTQKEIDSLIAALEVNKSIDSLDLSSFYLTWRTFDKFFKVIMEKKTITSFRFGLCPYEASSEDARFKMLDALLKRNQILSELKARETAVFGLRELNDKKTMEPMLLSYILSQGKVDKRYVELEENLAQAEQELNLAIEEVQKLKAEEQKRLKERLNGVFSLRI